MHSPLQIILITFQIAQQNITNENWNKIKQLKNWFWLFCFSYSVILLSDIVEKMSLFNYFQRKEISKEESLTAAVHIVGEGGHTPLSRNPRCLHLL